MRGLSYGRLSNSPITSGFLVSHAGGGLKNRTIKRSLIFAGAVAAALGIFQLFFGNIHYLLEAVSWGGIVGFAAGFLGQVIISFIAGYPHAGWRRLAVVLSPVAAVSVFFSWDDRWNNGEALVMAIMALFFTSPLLLIVRDLFNWVYNGFSEQEISKPSYSSDQFLGLYGQCRKSATNLMVRLLSHQPTTGKEAPQNVLSKVLTPSIGCLFGFAFGKVDPEATSSRQQIWFRIFARSIDLCLLKLVVMALSATIEWNGAIFPIGFTDLFFWAVITWTLLVFIEAFMLSVWATTPGKKIFGIQVLSKSSRKLTYGEAKTRSYHVLQNGLYFMIPMLQIVGAWKTYNRIRLNGEADWDRTSHAVVKFRPVYRVQLLTGAITAIILVMVIAVVGLAAKELYRDAIKQQYLGGSRTSQRSAPVVNDPWLGTYTSHYLGYYGHSAYDGRAVIEKTQNQSYTLALVLSGATCGGSFIGEGIREGNSIIFIQDANCALEASIDPKTGTLNADEKNSCKGAHGFECSFTGRYLK